MEGVLRLKADGNEHYKLREHAAADTCYTQALDALRALGEGAGGEYPAEDVEAQECALLSNRAACCLTLGKLEPAIADCEAVLAVKPGHTKALYRRGQARAALEGENLDDALKDFVHVLHIEPKNKAAASAASSVREKLQIRRSQLMDQSTVPGLLAKIMARRGADMDDSAADMRRIAGLTGDPAKALHVPRERAVPLVTAAAGSNDVKLSAPALTVLANVMDAGCHAVVPQVLQGLSLNRLQQLSASEARDLAAPASVLLSAVAKSGISRCPGGIDDAIAFEATQMLVGTILSATTDHNIRIGLECLARTLASRPEEPEGRPIDPKKAKEPADIKTAMKDLRKMAGIDKDKRNAPKVKASWRAVEAAYAAGALEAVLQHADTDDGIQRFCVLKVLDLLFGASAARCWMEMQNKAADWISNTLSGDTMQAKERGMAALACIASSARDVALEISQRADVLDEILLLAEANDFERAQLSAAELCAHLASEDPAKCFNPLGGLDALRLLSAHKNPRVAVRAVTALAKLASVNLTHRIRILTDGRVSSRAMAALKSEGEHKAELRSWAVEAMAYLSLYPEVKEPFDETLGISHVVQMLNEEVEEQAAAKKAAEAASDDGDAYDPSKQAVSGFVARGTAQFGLVSVICNLTSTELAKDEQIRQKLLEQGQEKRLRPGHARAQVHGAHREDPPLVPGSGAGGGGGGAAAFAAGGGGCGRLLLARPAGVGVGDRGRPG